jgi:hypothetical protein
LWNAYQTLRCNKSMNIYFLQSHFFPPNLGAVSDE